MIIDNLLKAIGVPKNQNSVRAVKSRVATHFIIDGELFIERFDLVSNTCQINDRNFRAKAIVDLLMSIECSLKSLIISLSQDGETPFYAYKTARGYRHNLTKLYKEAKERAKNRFTVPGLNQKLFDELISLGVGSRYSYDVWLIRLQTSEKVSFGEFSISENQISRTIDNFEWGVKLKNEAVKFNKLALKCHERYLKKHSILYGKNIDLYNKEIDTFLKYASRSK